MSLYQYSELNFNFIMQKLTLKKALKEKNLDQFIAEHDKDGDGDVDEFNAAISSMVQKSKATQVSPSHTGGCLDAICGLSKLNAAHKAS